MALNLTIVGYGHTRCGPEWGFATQGENFHRVYFVLGGDCRCTIHGETYFLQPETLYIPMDMQQWLRSVMDAPVRKALPVLSFPSIQLTGITVRDLIASSEAQAEGMAAIARRCDAAASVSMMDLSVEAECFGSTILVSDDEVPTVTGAVVSSMEDVARLPAPQVGDGRTGIYVEAIAKAKKLITDRPVFAGVIGPYSLAGRLMDVSQIMLNSIVDPVSVLRNGTPETVRAETLRILEKCCDHKNFLISSGCDIPPAAPWGNLDAFFAAVAEFYRR